MWSSVKDIDLGYAFDGGWRAGSRKGRLGTVRVWRLVPFAYAATPRNERCCLPAIFKACSNELGKNSQFSTVKCVISLLRVRIISCTWTERSDGKTLAATRRNMMRQERFLWNFKFLNGWLRTKIRPNQNAAGFSGGKVSLDSIPLNETTSKQHQHRCEYRRRWSIEEIRL